MAENSAVAFGRYLRTLRERRGHSLDDVESLSRALPERIGKGYLSRCENGRQRVAFSKIITLCRVYDVPSEVLIERMELDLELDRVGGPETEGLEFEDLTNRGKDSATRGAAWEAYGYFRDAIPVAATSEVQERFRDSWEQDLCAIMNYTIIASQHGRHTLSLHELEYVRSTDGLGPRCSTILLELLSQRTRSFGDLRRARALSDQAVHSADLLGSLLYRAHTYADRACLECEDKNFDEAISWYKQAHSLFQRTGLPSGSARTLQNLAQTYFDVGRLKASKRALLAAERLAAKHGFDRARAMIRILSGEIADKEGDADKALRLWRDAINIAKRLRDPIVRFKAEFQLYKHALHHGDSSSEASLKRLLERRATWVPDSLEELEEFKKLTA